jgi:hypothetical protein
MRSPWVGDIPKMRGWTQLSPCPRPLIWERPHPRAKPYTYKHRLPSPQLRVSKLCKCKQASYTLLLYSDKQRDSQCSSSPITFTRLCPPIMPKVTTSCSSHKTCIQRHHWSTHVCEITNLKFENLMWEIEYFKRCFNFLCKIFVPWKRYVLKYSTFLQIIWVVWKLPR